MALFALPKPTPVNTQEIALKVKNSKKKSVATPRQTGNTLLDRINLIRAKVQQELSQYENDYLLVRTEEQLIEYIDTCCKNGVVALDTETSSLDFLSCEIAGVSLYTPGAKACYIPLNHKSYSDGLRVANQISMEVAKSQLDRLRGTKQIMHNGKFDINVCLFGLGIDYSEDLFWDTMVGAKLLDERDPAGLKPQYAMRVKKTKGEGINDYSSLFEGIRFDLIPINIGWIYAAHDALMTYELYLAQLEEFDKKGNENLKQLALEIEMPLVTVVADMQRTGVALDEKTCEQLSEKYNGMLKEAKANFDKICEAYLPSIAKYNKKNPNNQFKLPVNPNSTKQLPIFMFDVLEIEHPDGKDKRGTGKEVLEKIDHPIVHGILEMRTLEKLLGTYIDKLPKVINSKTGRIHTSYNQNGADTGRMSSSDPNLQNIPSKNEEIRTMFTAGTVPYKNAMVPGVFLCADYSQQEPKVTAQLTQDKNMIQAYLEGLDLYAVIASKAIYHMAYEECLEKRPDGTYNAEGKKRRSKAKVVQLASTYGQQAYSLAADLGVSVKEAKQIQKDFNDQFPGIERTRQRIFDFAFKNGYVETMWGRRRQLPDMMLEPYEFYWLDGGSSQTDLLDFGSTSTVSEVPDHICLEYMEALDKCWGYKQKQKVMEQAKSDNIRIVDNTRKIADAERQSINTPIQGTSADMVKLCMVNLASRSRWKLNNEKLQKLQEEFTALGGKLVMQVHDELICQVPEETRTRCAEILSEIMIISPLEKISIPMVVDIDCCRVWNGEKIKC